MGVEGLWYCCTTLSLTQTVPVPGRAAASAGKAKMMDDDDDGTCKLR